MRGPLYLASTSPRRGELLAKAAIPFHLHPPGPEPEGAGSPRDKAILRARAKALGAVPPSPEGPVLGADTVVALGELELGKPVDRAAAGEMLRQLEGRDHEVFTAQCLAEPATGRFIEECAVARLRCAVLDPVRIEQYLDTGEWQGKAGGYAIQGHAADFLQLLAGDLDTVIGLSVVSVRRLLVQWSRGT
ncbi:MAG: Maf-like protein [Planctomycetes bacterium]|nr:Maf-like protein [Planctomycetota bacterium]MCB9871733.1 Maf-like protein [Planctomycetota bacterium]